MPFKEVERVIYKNNPLIQVVCQLRFPRILLIDENTPVCFQERIRRSYPICKPVFEQQEVTVDFHANSPAKISHDKRSNNYSFSSEDGVWQVFLTSTYLSLTTSKYDRWEDFLSRLNEPLNALLDEYAPVFYERIGLRYVDAYRRSHLGLDRDTPWSELIQPFALGFLSQENVVADVKGHTIQADIDLGDNAFARVITSTGYVGKPPLRQDSELAFIVDSDFYYNSKKEIVDLEVSLDTLHSYSGRLIRSIITEKLHEAMEPERI